MISFAYGQTAETSVDNSKMILSGRITESYPESMDPYRIIPLITESYPYTKTHPNMEYDSVICYCLGYDLVIYKGDNPRSSLSDYRSKGFSPTAENIR